MNRREFIETTCSAIGLAAVATAAGGKPASAARQRKKVLVLGMDGMDPQLLRQYVQEGHMPHFARLIEQGDFRPLKTSMPPQSPVAWATFITGMDPSRHGIYDFLHRNPETLQPYLSISEAVPAAHSIRLGSWEIPLSSGEVRLLRKGKAFWQILEEHGIPTTIFRMPANFPPAASRGYSLSDMGTPDILGTSGTFQYFTDSPPPKWKKITGGIVHRVRVENGIVEGRIEGPPNDFRWTTESGTPQPKHPKAEVSFRVYVDRENKTAKISVEGAEVVLKQGEWSDWLRVKFRMVPGLVGVNAIFRFYLKEVNPNFKLYMTPLQIDPENPAMPISTPAKWSRELAQELGLFYTQGLPEDTKAYSGEVFTAHEFWEQSQFIYRERRRALDYFLDRFQEGVLFFYFGSTDQCSHMLWHCFDEKHPFHRPEEGLADGLRTVYSEMDETLGHVLDVIGDDTTLFIMSDHGFAPFYRGVNLNTWLLEKGYITLKDPSRQTEVNLFENVDWSHTKAYALGLNGLYVNVKGREKHGIVEGENAYRAILDKIEQDLLATVDPINGNNAVSLVVQTQRDFANKVDFGPDIIVGYNRGYRITSESALGEMPKEVFQDNMDPWSADHCMDYRVVPGILVTNRKITLEKPALHDLTVTVLNEFGIPPLPEMIGRNCIAS